MRKPVRVLIADDHQVVREGLQMILAESEERTAHADPDDASGGHRRSEDTV